MLPVIRRAGPEKLRLVQSEYVVGRWKSADAKRETAYGFSDIRRPISGWPEFGSDITTKGGVAFQAASGDLPASTRRMVRPLTLVDVGAFTISTSGSALELGAAATRTTCRDHRIALVRKMIVGLGSGWGRGVSAIALPHKLSSGPGADIFACSTPL